jgi:hypothetical protein
MSRLSAETAYLMAPTIAAAVAGFSMTGAAGQRSCGMSGAPTEFLMLTLISMTQAIVGILINARTLRRTIGVGDSGLR